MRVDKLLLNEAIKIGDDIVSKSIVSQDFCYWETENGGEKGKSSKNILYNGNAGIILYLLDLYKVTKDNKYLDSVLMGCNYLKIYDYNSDKRSLSFYTGNGGIIYVFLEVYMVTNDIEYLNFSKTIVEKNTFDYSQGGSDLLNGLAGTILTQLHLYNHVKENWLLKKIQENVDDLLNRAIITEFGICWERSEASQYPLCGLSHGASGYCFIFLELYRYFGDSIFYQIAKSSMQYENIFYEKNLKNWPDFRMDISDKGLESLTNSYKSGRISEYLRPRFMSSWCHGAPGIGMARLHFYSTTNDTECFSDFKCCISNLDESINLPSYTLCHGKCGNASLYLDGYIITKETEYFEKARQIAYQAILEKDKRGYYLSGIGNGSISEISLFTGTAGIGHYYLRILQPDNIKSILLPKVILYSQEQNVKFWESSKVNTKLLRKIFPNSFSSLLNNNEIKNIINKEILLDIHEVFNIAIEVNENKNHIEIDLHRIKLSKSFFNSAFLFAKYKVEIDEYRLFKDNLMDRTIALNESVKLYVVDSLRNKNYIIAIATYVNSGTKQFTIGEFVYNLLLAITEYRIVNSILDSLYLLYSIPDIEKEEFDIVFFDNLESCFLKNFIRIAN